MKSIFILTIAFSIHACVDLNAQFAFGGVVDPSIDVIDIQAIDIDGDGDLDLMISYIGEEDPQVKEIAWYQNLDGNGTFASAEAIHGTDGWILFGLGDLDGDNDPDLVLHMGDMLFWRANDGDGGFAPPVFILDAPAGGVGALEVADITGDDAPEILVTEQGLVSWWVNLGGGTFSAKQSLVHGTSMPAHNLLVGDIDGDGDVDHIVIDINGNAYAGLALDDMGTVWTSQNFMNDLYLLWGGFSLHDVDGDGDLDIVDAGNSIRWVESLMTDGIWGDYMIHPLQEPQQMAVGSGDAGPLDCSGSLYLIWANAPFEDPLQMTAYVPGTGAFIPPQPLTALPQARLIHMADINGDGYNDLILANGDDQVLSWYINQKIELEVQIELVPFDTLCAFGDDYVLDHASPAGGTWNGPGVTDNTFQALSSGDYELTYTILDDATGCTFSASQTITTVQPVIIPPADVYICDTDPLVLTSFPSGGVWSGSADAFGVVDVSCAARPLDNAFYEVTLANGSCQGYYPMYNFYECWPANLGPDTTLCQNEGPYIAGLAGSSFGGGASVFGFDSVEYFMTMATGYFYPELHEPGDYVIHGSASAANHCTGRDTATITVVAPPEVELVLVPEIENTADPLPLSGGTPVGGVYSLAGDPEPITAFDPAQAGIGVHQLLYTYTDPITGCTDSDTAVVEVVLGGVGITALTDDLHMSVRPNPARHQVVIDFTPSAENGFLMWDATGRIVARETFYTSPAVIDVQHLAPGSYVIMLRQMERRQQAVLLIE